MARSSRRRPTQLAAKAGRSPSRTSTGIANRTPPWPIPTPPPRPCCSVMAMGRFPRPRPTPSPDTRRRSNTVSLLLGNGDGTFRAPQAFTVGDGAGALAIGDSNRDGKLDLAVANYVDATVSVLLGNGLGGFQPARVFAVAAAPWTLV